MSLESVLSRLRSQMSRGEVILFLGAGFSTGAVDAAGKNLPEGGQLTKELWDLAFPGKPFDETTRLGDAYYAGKARNESELRRFIKTRLSVDAERLPEFYRTWFAMPWHRCYSLNLDDIELAVARRFDLPRAIRSLSATSGRAEGSKDPTALEAVHLNGAVWDELDDMTFSDIDYGSRLTAPNAPYASCAADLVARPVLVVGTQLNESMLWQYLEYRKTRGPRGVRELRPGSYLVCRHLSPAREYVLRELNIDWIGMTVEEFERQVLQKLRGASEEGHRELSAKHEVEYRRTIPRRVSELATRPGTPHGEYLLGHEPTWADLQSGRAIERECDAEIYSTARQCLSGSSPQLPLVLTGTAGSGKSTSLMRLGLRLTAEGISVYWIDETSNIDPHQLRKLVLESRDPLAILVDDADLWGRTLSGWARDVPPLRDGVLFGCALRTTKVEGLLDIDTLAGIGIKESVMPPLTDADIEDLIRVLDQNNRLGILKGKSHGSGSPHFGMRVVPEGSSSLR